MSVFVYLPTDRRKRESGLKVVCLRDLDLFLDFTNVESRVLIIADS